jgi:hypothetical protein
VKLQSLPEAWAGQPCGASWAVLAFGYAVLVLMVGCVQRKLIYHPPGLDAGEQCRLPRPRSRPEGMGRMGRG